jgi:hypothetical protein
MKCKAICGIGIFIVAGFAVLTEQIFAHLKGLEEN